jgi:uncharacterized UPF0160 family protein
MIIDDKTYILEEKNYVPVECIKKQIVIGNTFNNNMKHFIGWKHRYNGHYKKTAAFTINAAGVVYKHFDPVFQSKYFGKIELDTKSIIVLIENDGWLTRKNDTDEFYTWKGDIYNGRVVGKTWRGNHTWANYTDEQFNSCVKLVSELCEEFFIPNIAMSHNTKVDDLTDFKGVIYKSNIEKYYMDVTPAWDFENFKNKIEQI